MLSFVARSTFTDKDHKQAAVHVQSKLCWYHVAITSDTITVVGPGVEEAYERDQFPENLTFEGLAIMAVVTFEESD